MKNQINQVLCELAGWVPHPNNKNSTQKFWSRSYVTNGCKIRESAAEPSIVDGAWGNTENLPDYVYNLNKPIR